MSAIPPLIESPFATARHYQPRGRYPFAGVPLPHDFGNVAAEYQAAHATAALFDRNDRGLLRVGGRDRAKWLHNLLTNSVATLDEGAGNYAFAVNVKGRTLFDLHVLCLPDVLWLDLGRSLAVRALQHLDSFHITEDIALADCSHTHTALACLGPHSATLASALGVAHFTALPSLGHVALPDGARLVRQDCGPLPGFTLLTPLATAPHWWDRLAESGARPAGAAAFDTLRIEAGQPVYGHDIDESVLPPETGLVEEGISYTKGCYLGYEIMERMRSRGALPRRLVRLVTPVTLALPLPTPLRLGDTEVGRVTSLVPHPQQPQSVGLGYVKTNLDPAAKLHCGAPAHPIHLIIS
ncbi:MAG: folate-binding protein YgfZ [Phycisphaerales bacterium]|nr:folate-binding protein YgfZ [Phycisphaerales bacterium]